MKKKLLVFLSITLFLFVSGNILFKQFLLNLPTYETERGDVFSFWQTPTISFRYRTDNITIYHKGKELLQFPVFIYGDEEGKGLFVFNIVYESNNFLLYQVEALNSRTTYNEGYIIKSKGSEFISLNNPKCKYFDKEIITNAIFEVDKAGFIDWPVVFSDPLYENSEMLSDSRVFNRLKEIEALSDDDLLNYKSLQFNHDIRYLVGEDRQDALLANDYAETIINAKNEKIS